MTLLDNPAPVAVPPATPARRIVPALVDGSPIYLECPGWCTLDHVARNESSLEDVYHSGESTYVETPDTGIAGEPQLMLFAQLNSDPYIRRDRREPHVIVNTGADDAHLTAAQAEEFADSLTELASRVRDMARLLAS